jgi:hypothetical protein
MNSRLQLAKSVDYIYFPIRADLAEQKRTLHAPFSANLRRIMPVIQREWRLFKARYAEIVRDFHLLPDWPSIQWREADITAPLAAVCRCPV